jgi:hypothetical protein
VLIFTSVITTKRTEIMTATQIKQIQNDWNDKSENLGCKARLGGGAKRVKYYEARGVDPDGVEIWFPIMADQFAKLTNNFYELRND